MGCILESAQADLDERTFAEVTSGLDSDAVRSYIPFAKKHREPIKDFTLGIRAAFEAALRTTGALPTPDGFGAQISHDPPPFFAWRANS
jgi:hypothetical protein